MSAATRWSAGLAASVGLHVAAGFALLAALTPEQVPEQPMPETEIEVVSHTLDRTAARPVDPDAAKAVEEDATGAEMRGEAIATSRATGVAPSAERLADATVSASEAIAAATATGERAEAATADDAAARLVPERADAASAPAVAGTARPTATVSPEAETAVAAVAAPAAIPSAEPAAARTEAARAEPSRAQPVAADAVPVAASLSAAAEVAAVSAPRTTAATRPDPVPQDISPTKPDAVKTRLLGPDPRQVASAEIAAQPALASPALDSVEPILAVARTGAPLAETAPPAPKPAAPAPPATAPAPESRPAVATAPPATPEPERAGIGIPSARPVGAAQPRSDHVKAALAFPGGGEGVDPVSFAAFQSFMQPGDLAEGADPVRDGISGILSHVPCSRLQVGFDPETTTLTVNGHIPEDGLRNTIVAEMQARMGADIAVSDNMLILPRPQCNALSGIASVGLPQSTDQFTNPLVIGEDTHARVFGFVKGDYLSLDLTAPDYDAVIYLDYFDADGQVLHLEPNEYSPLRHARAKTAQRIGAKSAEDSGLKLLIGPPYGQEIAVAFAASHPLYDGLRPIQEPAGPYLDWLKQKVSEARARHADFKGEWVYFFVTTSAQ